MSNQTQLEASKKHRPRKFKRGDWVQVRSLEEIQAALDAEGKNEGIPFMPEMIKYCGRKFRVARRADHIFLDRLCYVARLKNTVFLGDLRCDGKAHGGCQMGCQLFWKEAWLKPADPPTAQELVPPKVDLVSLELPTTTPERFTCQATELVRATTRLPWWDVRQYISDLRLGETTFKELFVEFVKRGKDKFLRIIKKKQYSVVGNLKNQPTPTENLNLREGDWVEVRSLEEILATLDAKGRNRGLGFGSDQAAFCGKRYRVAGRVEKIILEWSGEMKTVANTVKLDELTCHGRMCRSCPRNCLHLWREIWLKRVPGPQ
ncbi:MAG TPA: hypothetical protein VIH42_05525 [Thermoguttaceae bacterium]